MTKALAIIVLIILSDIQRTIVGSFNLEKDGRKDESAHFSPDNLSIRPVFEKT
jgi:hypothetical protein